MKRIEEQLLPHQRLVQYNYMTLPHDNMATLVERFGCPPEWILYANKLKRAEDVRPGQRLKIPVAVPFLRSIWARGRRIHVVTDRPYGRQFTRAGGMIHLSAIDRSEDSGPDEVQFLHATWPDPRDKGLFTLEWTGLRASRRDGGAYGGVGIQVPLHGPSGAGNSKMPATEALAAVWGWARVYRNGKPVADKAPVHAAITSAGGRCVLDVIIEADGLPDRYTHLQARTVDLCLSD